MDRLPFDVRPLRIADAIFQGQEVARQRQAHEQAMALRQAAEERARQENEYAQQVRPLELTGRQLALRGQMLGTVETPEDYARVLPAVQSLGLPTGDLPSGNQSTAWLQFRKPEQAQSWLPERFRPADLSPVPQAERMAPALSQTTMQAPGIAPEDVASVQRAAERGLPIIQQSKIRDADVGRQIQLANLARVQEKDAISREWLDFQKEAKIQGMTEAEAQRKFLRRMQERGFDLDVQRFTFQKEVEAARTAAGRAPNEGQSKAALYGGQIVEGFGELNALMDGGFDPTTAYNSAGVALAGSLANPLVSEKAQLWKQSVDRISNAALRFESGAAIGDQEAARKIKEAIPGYGDSPAVVKSKMRTIERIIKGLEVAAGPAGASVRVPESKPAAKPSSSKLPTEAEWNAAWASAKPGDVVTGPNGKKYTKGGR